MTSFVLMTAMPPTKGHLNLIRFAAGLSSHTVVIVCTQPSEPFPHARYTAVKVAMQRENPSVSVKHLHQMLEQNPAVDGFWPMWDALMRQYGFLPGDLVVSSEAYGQTLADRLGGIFMPYDPDRELYYTKATDVRDHMRKYFADILPEFQENLRTRITVFGAESTGKTTLSRKLSYELNGHWLFEYARPYLETVGTEITKNSMKAIWQGQNSLQRSAEFMKDKPFIVQDTDLFSTVGYWTQPHWQDTLGPLPSGLVRDALSTRSDLYILTKSNIPFETDPLRYGGDHRESSDKYWTDVLDKYGCRYVVLESDNRAERLTEAVYHASLASDERARMLEYDRGGM